LVSDIVTRRPPDTGTTDRTLFVSMPLSPSMLAVVWYTQVLPTAMGYGAAPAGPNAFDFAFGVVTGLATALEEVLTGAAPELLAVALHPARATTAAPAITALADLNLLIRMPRSVM
jgi:hypothetical protein